MTLAPSARGPILRALVVAAALVAGVAAPAPAAPAAAPVGEQAAPASTGFGAAGIPARPASERYVREAYTAVLARSVDEPSLAYWGGRLDQGTSRGTFARQVVLSVESVRAHVLDAYDAFGRTPSAAQRDLVVKRVRTGATTVERELVRLLSSQEFYEREGSDSDAGFVLALYANLLDRAPDEGGMAFWLARLSGGTSREVVASSFVHSTDRLRAAVADAYDRVLGRGADAAGRDYWAARIRRGASILDVDRQLLASAEAWGAGCSILDRSRCLLPFPNDELTLPDATTATGRRVVLKPTWVPPTSGGATFDPTEWNRQDGFSPGSAILVHNGGIDPEESGLAPLTDIGASLADDAPIVLVDTQTGERWPYWVELDANAPNDAQRALVIRPARNLTDGHTYAVGIGEMHDADGDAIAAPSGFRTFRDGLPSDSRRVEEERVRVEYAIDQVAAAGLDRDTLHLAWTFTVASTRNLAERAVHMRDEVLGGANGGAGAFTVTGTTDQGDVTRVDGTYKVPLYLTNGGAPGARLRYGSDWLPEAQGTMDARFTCTVPDTARTTPARASLYGHGLLGTGSQASSGYVRALAAEHNIVLCGTDYIGMAEDDYESLNIVQIVADLATFPQLADRNQQGLLNFLVLGRLMTQATGFVTDARFQGAGGTPAIDREDLYWYGLSQGGIMGGALIALSPDITRGVLGVPGINYSTLLHRSVDFDPFFGIVKASYPDALDRMLMLDIIQMLWDRGEGNGYANHLTADPLPGAPTHEVLLQVAYGDHQVAMAAADVQARTYGAATNDPPLVTGRGVDDDDLWGIERIASWPHAGSATIYWDSGVTGPHGVPSPPVQNIPPRAGSDPHGDPRSDPDAREQISAFLRPDGVVIDTCDGGPCRVDEFG